MSADQCPYCGTVLTTSLKFCVNCRRSVTEDKIRQAGARLSDNEEGEDGQAKFKLAKRGTYDGVRQFRSFFLTVSALLGVFFIYYCGMKFVAHQEIPFEDEIIRFVQSLEQNK